MMMDPLPLQQLEVMLDINNKKILKELAAIKAELLQKIDAVEQAVRKIRVETHAPVQQTGSQFDAASPPVREEVPAARGFQPAVANTQPIDRNGVAPADVSIEKIFYMGNR